MDTLLRQGGSMKTLQSAIVIQVRVLALSLGIILCGLVAPGMARAAPIQFSFTGVVLDSNIALSPPFAINQSMSGFFTVSSPLDASADSNPSGNIARHNNVITNLSVTIGASSPYVATFGPSNNHITIRNNPAFDSGELGVSTLTSGDPVNGFTPRLFDIRLLDGTAGAFNSQYPTTVPSLSSFSSTNQWRLVFGPGGRVVQGMLTSLTAAVPLPAVAILFGAGLIALVGLGAGGLRNLRRTQA
jgi:hypothetical protein